MSSILIILAIAGNDYFYKPDYVEAYRYYDLAIQVFPEYDVLYRKAICCLMQGRPEETMRILRSLPEKNDVIIYYLGVAYFRVGDYDNARINFEQLSERYTDRHYYLALISLKNRDMESAKAHVALLPAIPEKAQLAAFIENYERLVLAWNLYMNGEYEGAFTAYDRAGNFEYYREIGQAMSLARLSRYEQSLARLEDILDSCSDQAIIRAANYESGRVNYMLKNYATAKERLTKYLEYSREDDAAYLLGRIYSDESDYDSAFIFFNSLPDSIDDYLFFKGRTEYFRGFWGSAEEKLLRHREFFPVSVYADRAIYILGMIDYKRNEYRAAIDYWNDLIQLFPKSALAPSTAKGIGDAYFALERYRDALTMYQKVKEFNPPAELKVETSLKTYETLFHLGGYASITDALQRFIEVNPDSSASGGLVALTRLRIARIFFEKKDYYRSLAELDKIFEEYPGSAVIKEALVERARVYQAIGYPEKRKTALRTLMARKDAGEYLAYAACELGTIYLNEMKHDSALFFYNLLLDNAKYREMAILEIAKIYQTIGQYKESEVMIDKLIADFPASPYVFEAYIIKSRLYRIQGDFQNAIKILNDLSEMIEDKPEIFQELGDIYFEIQDYPSARDNYVKASTLFKDQRDQAGLALIHAGDITLIMGDRKMAKEYYLRASLIAKSPSIKNQAEAKLTSVNE